MLLYNKINKQRETNNGVSKLKIGNTEFNRGCALAPMAGVADSAFRELCIRYGAAYTVSEMVSAKALTMNDKKSRELLTLGEKERPVGVQLFGSEPEIMAEAVKIAEEYSPLFVDINMGCPAPKIVKNGCGSTLLKNPELAGKIVYAVKNATKLPVTVKFRTGWDETSVNCVEFAKVLADNGADILTLHGRTRERMYAPPADLDSIRAVKRAVNIPVVGNGDVYTPEDAKYMYEYTGCDFIMLGRGALGTPWIFRQINEYLTTETYEPTPDNKTRMDIMLAHAKRICELRGKKNGMCEIRKHALWYTKGLRGSAKLRNRFSTVASLEELQELAELVISEY